VPDRRGLLPFSARNAAVSGLVTAVESVMAVTPYNDLVERLEPAGLSPTARVARLRRGCSSAGYVRRSFEHSTLIPRAS